MTASDLRSFCSPMRDQGSCGSCTAFGTIGVFETAIRIVENQPSNPVDLSERDLFFCSGGSCEYGNTMEPVLNQTLNGVCSEECCPYDGLNHNCGEGRCNNWRETLRNTKSWRTITDVAEMKTLLDKEPLISTMMVHQSFMNYVDGVYHNLGLFDPVLGGHCIAIVGYDDKLGAWLMRNSWGTDWGMSGYAWVKYNDSSIDEAMYELIPNGEVPPSPTPSPCILGNQIARILNVLPRILRRKGRFRYLNPLETGGDVSDNQSNRTRL